MKDIGSIKNTLAKYRSETLKAYFAGIIDGEGCIRITTHSKPKRHLMIVDVANTKPDFINLIRLYYGGYYTEKDDPRSNRQKNYRITLSSVAAKEFLEDIFDYLIIKRPQAELALKFQKTMGYKKGQMPKSVFNLREKYKNMMHQLNIKGAEARSKREEVMSNDSGYIN